MSEPGKESTDSGNCLIEETDSAGNSNLCCCYVLDPNDNYADPCYLPAEDCCCCDPIYE